MTTTMAYYRIHAHVRYRGNLARFAAFGAIVAAVLAASALPECRAAEAGAPVVREENGIRKTVLLPPAPGNPRNSEGDFIRLKDGRVLFVYTHFTGGRGDHAAAHLAGRYSRDGGTTWSSSDVLILPNEGGMNVMSVSLLRLSDDEIALFYLRKNSTTDNRPYLRISTDECQTWSDAIEIIPDEQTGYYVLNNDRVIQLDSGRLVAPVARHNDPQSNRWDPRAVIMCYLSDDRGRSWQRSKSEFKGRASDGSPVMLQEPGVVELQDGRLMMFIRSDAGTQQVSYSDDGGETWTAPRASTMISPLSPATIERIPQTGDLLLVWNNHESVAPEHQGKRTPLHAAISSDEGQTWQVRLELEDDPDGWYCYTAMEFVDGHVLLGYCAGNRPTDGGLAVTQITRFPIDLLYRDDPRR